MTNTSRRLVAFVAAGLLCAIAVGITVWRMSAPDSVVTKPSAATAASSAATTPSSTTQSYTTTASPSSSRTKQPQDHVAAPAEDPYLAPNAVMNRTEPAGPTAVYRPDNVSSLQNQQPQATLTTQYPQAPLSTAPAVPPSQGSATAPESSAPNSPQPGTEPTQPPTTSDSPTTVPQESPTGDQPAGPQSTGQPQPEEPLPPQPADPSTSPGSFIPRPAGFTHEPPAPNAGHDEPAEPRALSEAGKKPWDTAAPHGGDGVNAAERETATHRSNEAPTPAAPKDDAPAAQEPSAALHTAPHPAVSTPSQLLSRT